MTESEDYSTKPKDDLVRQADRALAARSSDLVLRGLQLAQELDTAAAGGEPAAEELWRRAEQGDADAQCLLGLHHILGEGVQENPTLGVEWLRKAAEQSQAAAQYALGECYRKGEGVEKNPAAAAQWYRKAADQWTRKAADEGGDYAQWALRIRFTCGDCGDVWTLKDVEELRECLGCNLRYPQGPIEPDGVQDCPACKSPSTRPLLGCPKCLGEIQVL